MLFMHDEATIASTAAAILIQGNNSFYAAAFVAAVVSMLLPLQHVCCYLFSICAAIVSAFVLLLLQHPYCSLCNICAATDPYPYSYNTGLQKCPDLPNTQMRPFQPSYSLSRKDFTNVPLKHSKNCGLYLICIKKTVYEA